MKKMLSILLAVGLLIGGLAGCKSKQQPAVTQPNTQAAAQENTQDATLSTAVGWEENVFAEDSTGDSQATNPTADQAQQGTAQPAPSETTKPTTQPQNPTTQPPATQPTEGTQAPATQPTEGTQAPATQPTTQPTGTTATPSTEAPVPPSEPAVTLTEYERYMAMSAAERTAFRNTFPSPEAFFDWYNQALADHKAANPPIEIAPDGNIPLG